MKDKFLKLIAILSCYLVFSITFVSASQIARFSSPLEPKIVIKDELPVIKCDSKGMMRFRFYAENIFSKFDISEINVYVIERNNNIHDISSLVSCSPLNNILSNQLITCSIDIQDLLIKLPNCPLRGGVENDLKIVLKISTQSGQLILSDLKKIVIAKAGTQPSMSVVNIPNPNLNCIVGSEIDTILKINHAEVFENPKWSFVVNEKARYGSEYIECSLKNREYFPEERIDTYLCTLQVSNSTLTSCSGKARIDVFAITKDYNLSVNFNLTVVRQEFSIGMEVYPPGTIECQIVDNEGTCIPTDPQQTFDILITGSVPEKLNIYGFRYRLEDEEFSDTICKKYENQNRYSCLMFVTMDKVSSLSQRDLEVQADAKYLTTFSTISATSTVSMEGKLIDESINRTEVLENKKEFFKYLEKAADKLNRVVFFINFITTCCSLPSLDQMVAIGDFVTNMKIYLKQIFLKNLIKQLFWDKASSILDNLQNLLMTYGPGLLKCLSLAQQKIIENEIKNLKDFEEGSLQQPLDIPSNAGDPNTWYGFAACVIKEAWSGKVWGIGCAIFLAVLASIAVPATAAIISNMCFYISQTLGGQIVAKAITTALFIISTILGLKSIIETKEMIENTRESLNTQLKVQQALEEYSESYARTMENIVLDASLGNAVNKDFSPDLPEIKLVFFDQNNNLLEYNHTVCKNDVIKIEYEFSKFNVTGNFNPELQIPRAGRTLVFDNLSGTYGPVSIKDLFSISENPPTPSNEYDFLLNYDGSIGYKLYYDSTC